MGNLVARCSTETAHQKIAERIREHYEALIVQPYGNQNAVEAPHSQLNSLFNLLRRHDPDFVCLPRNMMHFTSPETFFILPLSTKVAIANNWAPSCIRFFQNTGTVALNEAKALVSEIHASEAFETNQSQKAKKSKLEQKVNALEDHLEARRKGRTRFYHETEQDKREAAQASQPKMVKKKREITKKWGPIRIKSENTEATSVDAGITSEDTRIKSEDADM